jgi:hypothetical protein
MEGKFIFTHVFLRAALWIIMQNRPAINNPVGGKNLFAALKAA